MTGQDIGATVIAWGGLLALISRGRVGRILREHENRTCECDGSGTVLTDGPCDGAPVEVPCSCRRVPAAAIQYFQSSAASEPGAARDPEPSSRPLKKEA